MNPMSRSSVNRRLFQAAMCFLTGALMTAVLGCGGSETRSPEESSSSQPQLAGSTNAVPQQEKSQHAKVAPGATLAPEDFTKALQATGARYVVIQVFQEACAPCMTEALRLTELAEQWRKDGVAILGLGMDETPDSVRAFFEHTGERISYPLYHASWFAKQQKIAMTPTVFIYSTGGEQLYRTDPEQA
ncbi:MAG: TlpA family protein disulfide reductase, partial [Planctomycetes bacterium]|nr:TlpA family protein disulfide reductase [Planctomycetota bacterium]